MPDLNENAPRVRELLLGENGVIRTWLRAGARGWRLDVADELSDGLIADIKRAVLGRDARRSAARRSLGGRLEQVELRQARDSYLLGDELDSAMNYPLRDAILGFLVGDETAYAAAERLETPARELSAGGPGLRPQPARQP